MPTFLTPQGQLKIEEGLNHLKEKRPQIAERIAQAKELGDLSENTEYTSAKEDQAWIENEIKRLENLLKSAEVVANGCSEGVVRVGSKVKLKNSGGITEYVIAGKEESDPTNGKISYESPLGQALLGRKINEKVQIVTPKGETSFKIIAIK